MNNDNLVSNYACCLQILFIEMLKLRPVSLFNITLISLTAFQINILERILSRKTTVGLMYSEYFGEAAEGSVTV